MQLLIASIPFEYPFCFAYCCLLLHGLHGFSFYIFMFVRGFGWVCFVCSYSWGKSNGYICAQRNRPRTFRQPFNNSMSGWAVPQQHKTSSCMLLIIQIFYFFFLFLFAVICYVCLFPVCMLFVGLLLSPTSMIKSKQEQRARKRAERQNQPFCECVPSQWWQ